jgi:hypothetical protein
MKMKVSIKKMSDDAEDSLLDELIGKCEGAMVNPFKKKVEEPEVEASEEHPEESSESEEDLSPEDLEKLMEMYNKLKGE